MKIVEYDLTVLTNNFFLSNIIGELSKEENDRLGFILGQVVDQEIKSVEHDSENIQKKVVRKLCLQSFVFSPLSETLEDDDLKVNKTKISSYLTNKGEMEIIGMFSFRPHSLHNISLREISVFNQLRDVIVDTRIQEKDQFLFLLFTMDHENPLVSVNYTAMHSQSISKEERDKEKDEKNDLERFFQNLVSIDISISNIEEGISYDLQGDEYAGLFDKEVKEIQLDNGIKELETYITKELKELNEFGKEISKLTTKISCAEKTLMSEK